ncbi:MAG: DUF4230 domain-containing protein [Prevotella sp.]
MNGETSGRKPTPVTPRHKAIQRLTLAIIVVAALVMAVIGTCRGSKAGDTPQPVHVSDSTIIMAIQSHSRLYTAETRCRKNISFSSDNAIRIDVAGIKKDIGLPMSRTAYEIPVIVTYKAFIDLEKIRRGDIATEGDTVIHITLPDPVITETAVCIDHDRASYSRQLFGKKLTEQEYNALIIKAKDDAWRDLSQADREAMVHTAKISATETLIPMMRKLGFKHITIDYRNDYTIIHNG